MPYTTKRNTIRAGEQSRLDNIRAEVAGLITSAPSAVRPAFLNLLRTCAAGLRKLNGEPHFTELDHSVQDWAALLNTLTNIRIEIDVAQKTELDRYKNVNDRHLSLKKRFESLRRSYENSRLMIEIFYELIRAGQEFQTPADILRQSAEILLEELGGCLYVCRLRKEDGSWENTAANTYNKDHTPLFVRFMEETHPRHPVMLAVSQTSGPMYVLSNNLVSAERGGDSFGCEAFQDGYRSRLSFILRDPGAKAFGLIMLYSQVSNYFDRFEKYFLTDCANIVSLTVGRRMAVGSDAVAKAAGGMAHVGNNILSIIMNHAEMMRELLDSFRHKVITLDEDRRLLTLAGDKADPVQAMQVAARLFEAIEVFDIEQQSRSLSQILQCVGRMAKAIRNLLKSADQPLLMHYINGEEVLDLEPGGATKE